MGGVPSGQFLSGGLQNCQRNDLKQGTNDRSPFIGGH